MNTEHQVGDGVDGGGEHHHGGDGCHLDNDTIN